MIYLVGGNGFIGRHLKLVLEKNKIEYNDLPKNTQIKSNSKKHTVIYLAGMKGNFRSDIVGTIDSHVNNLVHFIDANFESIDKFIYISSIKVYDLITDFYSLVTKKDISLENIYISSKILGENLVLNKFKDKARIIRLSNVVGSDSKNTFLDEIIESALQGNIQLNSSLEFERDYISVNDAAKLIFQILTSGENLIYDVASGKNISNKQIVDILVSLTNCEINISNTNNLLDLKPPVDISNLASEFDFRPESVIVSLPRILREKYENSR